jgi:CRISPR/Cas system CSM-associated protein Csm2 small subunit
MKKITISSMLVVFALTSCNEASVNESQNKSATHVDDEHNHEEKNEAIELNNGKKWVVDSKMMIHIREMENIVGVFNTEEQKDYKKLAIKLQSNIDLLTASCTMQGKAHDELHKWLVPFMDMVSVLTDEENDTEAAKQFKNIQTSLITFNTYFQ